MFFSKKYSGKRIKLVAFLLAFVMMIGFMPKAFFTAFAAAPAAYTDIAPNSSVTVNINSSYGAKYYRFVPSESGSVTFYSSDYSGDPRVALLNSAGSELSGDDDSGVDRNFSLTYSCVANTTYYIKAYMYSEYTGYYTLHVNGGGVAVNPNPIVPAGDVININQTGSFSLFNSGLTSSSGSYYSSSSNYNEASYNNGGYDLYANQSYANEVIQLGLPFTMEMNLNEHATVSIYAYDVDEYDQFHGHSGDERDIIYLVDETSGSRTRLDGHLSGQNQTWNTTALAIAPNLFIAGHTYHFELDVDCTCSSTCGYWVVYVRTVGLTVNGDAPVQNQTGIESADLSAEISSSGLVTVGLTAKSYAEQDYALEFKAVCSANGAQYGGIERDAVIGTTSSDFNYTFQLEADAIRGTYEISVFIKDSLGNLIATRTATVSYGYSAVSYNSNGGSQNIPVDGETYNSGDSVIVKFDRVPSLYGYTFLGWSTDRYATEPTYTENGLNNFVIGGSDIVLYAVWGTESIPSVPGVLGQGNVLLIEDNLPWGYSANTNLLNDLLDNEKITEWDKISTSEVTLECLKEYSVVLIANVQGDLQSINNLKDVFTEYVRLGGVLVYGACTQSDTALLPDGVQSVYNSSHNNYIVDNNNPIITRVYSENSSLFDSDFVGNACNHNYFTNLPANSNVILQDASGRATLAEYAIGDGHVIASGLTWEFYYSDLSTYSNKAYDDLLLYALSLSGDIVEDDENDVVVDIWDGTTDTDWYDPSHSEFTIYTAEELAGLAYLVNNGNSFSGKTIYLGNNIDLSGYNWTPIGDDEYYAFAGTFDGRYHFITGLYLEKTSSRAGCGIGLFGTIEYSTLRNLGVEDADVVVHGGRSGILCGVAKSDSLIENCYTTGSITFTGMAGGGGNCVGGFVGDMQGGEIRIRNCYSSSEVSSTISDNDFYIGGFVGFVCGSDNRGSIKYIENCYSNGTVETPSGAKGGLVGELYFGTIYVTNCFSDATLNSSYAGMIIGFTYSDINCYINNTYYSDAGNSYLGGIATSTQNFKSQSWIESNLGWDFDTVWKFDGNDYPVLQGFDGAYYQPHTHEFTETYRTDATCTVDGRIVYECSCGEERYEIIRAPGHDIETVVETEVTCETDGLIVDRCTNDGCDYEKRTIIHGEHNFVVTDRQEATCEENGYVEYTCSNCGEKNYEEIEGRHNYVESSRVEPQVDVEGSITYECTLCGDTYSVPIPALIPVLKNSAVLLIQDSLPWAENVNVSLLETLMERGVVSYFNIINTSALATHDLSQYGVVFIANDQSTSMYNRLAENAQILENYVRAGGNLIYGACDQGWGGGGTLSHALPGGVTTSNYYSVYNYIVNELHPVVTGVYTDNRNLRDELLKGNYCSHTYFDTATLVDGTNVILRDANGNPTLIEYNLGEGTVMATGLTWEYFYVRNHYDMLTNYSKYAYDDLVTYMVYMSNTCEHSYEVVETVEATCEENGYTKYSCTLCHYEYMTDIEIAPGHSHVETDRTEATCCSLGEIVYTCHCGDVKTEVIDYLDHIPSDWIIDVEPTNRQEGSHHKECIVCGEILETETIPAILVIGDVNDDGAVDVADVVTLRRYLVGDDGIIINTLQTDIDEDGEITVKDLILLRKYLVDGQIQ